MAQIYLARQTGLGSFERHVVLKTIVRERASDQRFVTMFLDEAKLAATLNHQNVAQVYEVDQADGAYFMAMEYVHGENTRAILETTIRRGWTIPLELAVMIISGAAAGLHHAHERRGKNGQPLNIVHRDVSPANIMVGYDGSIKMLDFGIAKAEERATKTVGGTIKGKYGYMSPEQCKGKPIDRRSDIFALGIVLYELTTLRRAFKGNDDFETMKRIVAGDLVLPSTIVPGFPRELEAIILTALANDTNARFQSAQEMIEALDAFTVRAKLTGSNTAMGRFMLQLFGTKKEPWIDAAVQSSDQTVVTPVEIDDNDDDNEDDNDETLVIANRQDVQRALVDLSATAGPPPAAGAPHPSPSARMPVAGASRSPSGRMPAAGASHPSPSRPPIASASHPVQVPPAAETEPAGRPIQDEPKRPSARRSAERPSLPFASPGFDRTPPVSPGAPLSSPGLPPASHLAPPGTPAPGEAPPPLTPSLATTLIGPVAPSLLPATPTSLPRLVASDEISDVGAQPLVSDPKLGWQTSVRLTPASDGGHTRLPSEPDDFRIRSNTKWIVLSFLIVLGIAAGLVVIFLT